MNLKRLKYSEAFALIQEKFKKEKSIKAFCLKHKITYQLVLNFRNKPNIKRIKTAIRILNAYGYTVESIEKEIYFNITVNNTLKNGQQIQASHNSGRTGTKTRRIRETQRN